MRSRYEEIGGLFRKIREENGLKQSQMAEIADCSLRNYQNIELGITQHRITMHLREGSIKRRQ